MLGEIIKSTEALRYHAKSAEIAGQNLAHVNDENYARQRVLSKEGLMHKGQGGLNTSALEGSGLEHSRNELLDKRVFSEFSESANLETQKEILSLLQAALGESIDRQSLGGALNQDIESNLSAGGLARAIDDLFNAFQELSASPDEATAKEEIINKINTLTKRFNDAGQAIDEIDSDLSDSVQNAVNETNKILEQIYDLNIQIKRFELLGQGKAVTYRDNRQALLEDLSKLIDFKIEPEIDPNSNNETGFWNISVSDGLGNRIDLVNAENGVVQVSKEFGNITNLKNVNGEEAQVRAKINSDGTLGHVEVLDGGSLYDDQEGPILFAISPPLSSGESSNTGSADQSYNKGDVFSKEGKLYQALSDTIAGAELSDPNLFLEISQMPENGKVFPESLRKYSDLESFDAGEQVYYEGKLYQTLDSVGVKSDLKLDESDKLSRNLSKGEVVELEGVFYQITENKTKGHQVDRFGLSEAKVGELVDGFLALGETPPQNVEDISFVPSVIDTTRPDRWFLTKSYQKGDFVKYEENFFQFTEDVYRETELDDFARAMQSLTYNQKKNYQAGDFVKLDGSYYKFTADVPAFADVETVALSLSEAFGTEAQQFDGVLQSVEDPNWHFIKSNGSFKIADSFREYELSELAGSEQTKQIRISGINGDESDVYNFKISINGEIVNFDNDAESENSFSLTGFDNQSFSQNLKNKLLEISSDGSAISESLATDPAFEISVDEATGDLLISGTDGLGDFNIESSIENLVPQGNGDVEPTISTDVVRDYLADQFNFVFSSESFDDVALKIPFKGNSAKTAESIVQAISDNEVLSQSITASTINGQVYFRAKEQDFDFSVKLADTNGIEDLHNDLTNQTKISTTIQSEPTSELIKEAFEGVPVSTTLNNFSGLEVAQKTEIIFPGAFGEATGGIDYGDQISLNLELAGNNTIIEIPESPGRTLEELITQTEEVLLSIESDGTFQQGIQATDPAFTFENRFGEETGVITTWRNDRAGEIWVTGVPGLGNFNLTSITENTSVRDLQDYSSDDYNLFIEGKNGDLGSISVPFKGNEEDTVEAIKEAINNDDILNKEVIAVAQGNELTVTGLNPESDFSNIRWNIEGELAPQTVTFNGVAQPSSKQTFEIGNLDGVEQVQKSSIQFIAGPGSEESIPFSISFNGVDISLELPEGTGDPLDLSRFESLETELNSINKDGSKTVDGSASTDPAFDVTFVNESQTFLLSGNQNLGDFLIDVNATASLESNTFQEFISDEFNIEIQDENGQLVGSVIVPSKTDATQNAKDIVAAINNNPNIGGVLNASLSVDGRSVLLESLDTETKFTASVSTNDNLNEFTATATSELTQTDVANVQSSGPRITRIEKNQVDAVGIVSSKVQSIDFKLNEEPMVFGQNEIYYFNNEDGGFTHFLVTAPTPEVDPSDFNPLDAQWSEYFKIINPQLMDDEDPSIILRKPFPSGYDLENGTMIELNIGLAEAVVNKGQITGFNILNAGNGLPNTDAIFAEGREVSVGAGKIKGLQDSRSIHLERFRNDLNDLVVSFVESTNKIYNPDDQPGAYLFGFDAVLTRPISGRNLLMEEEYGYFGREGDASITLYRDEVEMTLPHASSESFSIVNTTPIFPEEFSESALYYRGGEDAEILFRSEDANELFSFYGSASKMQYVNMENDDSYPGADSINGTEDDGRSLMMAYESIPFRIEGLEPASKLPIIGDNFTFSALLSNPWNLATSLKVDKSLNSDSLRSSNENDIGSNDIALALAELGDQEYIDKVALLNADMGLKIADLNDNLEHQKSIETLLLDQRRAVSSVSIDEEVANLMRFQRSFQASSRVLSTLDKMLEIVVMGLVR